MSSVLYTVVVLRMGFRMVNGRWWLVEANFSGITVEGAKLYVGRLRRFEMPVGDHDGCKGVIPYRVIVHTNLPKDG